MAPNFQDLQYLCRCGEAGKLKEKLENKQKELSEVKKESRKRKKMIAVYQVIG